ncbi:MAG: CbiQ family ECF transporter T component [Alsobacter sp.]
MISAYVAGRSWLHRIPFLAKLIVLAGASVALARTQDWRLLSVALAAVLLLYASAGRAMVRRLVDLRPLWPMLLVIAGLQFGFESAGAAAASVLRLLALVALASLVTYTTTLAEMMETLEPAFRPLRWFGLQPRVPALAIALVLRLAPLLLALWADKSEAWRARTNRRLSFRIVPAFLANAMAMADHLAEALDARGFSTTIPRRPRP